MLPDNGKKDFEKAKYYMQIMRYDWAARMNTNDLIKICKF